MPRGGKAYLVSATVSITPMPLFLTTHHRLVYDIHQRATNRRLVNDNTTTTPHLQPTIVSSTTTCSTATNVGYLTSWRATTRYRPSRLGWAITAMPTTRPLPLTKATTTMAMMYAAHELTHHYVDDGAPITPPTSQCSQLFWC